MLLVSENLSDDDKNFCLTGIKESSDRLLNTINSVLEMSQLLSGSIIANFAKTDPVELVKAVYEEFVDLFKNKNLAFNIEIDDSINEIYTDQNILKKTLIKLVDNAFKFTESDGQVSIGIKPLAEQVEIFVSDTGIGMDDETIENAFTTFFKNDPSSRNKEGVGLGLALAQDFCKLLNGKIHISSSPEKGTYAGVTLPIQQPNLNN
jgi:signal transduction histidine kinase